MVFQAILRILKEIRLLIVESIINLNALLNFWLKHRNVILEIFHFVFKLSKLLLILSLFFSKL